MDRRFDPEMHEQNLAAFKKAGIVEKSIRSLNIQVTFSILNSSFSIQLIL